MFVETNVEQLLKYNKNLFHFDFFRQLASYKLLNIRVKKNEDQNKTTVGSTMQRYMHKDWSHTSVLRSVPCVRHWFVYSLTIVINCLYIISFCFHLNCQLSLVYRFSMFVHLKSIKVYLVWFRLSLMPPAMIIIMILLILYLYSYTTLKSNSATTTSSSSVKIKLTIPDSDMKWMKWTQTIVHWIFY